MHKACGDWAFFASMPASRNGRSGAYRRLTPCHLRVLAAACAAFRSGVLISCYTQVQLGSELRSAPACYVASRRCRIPPTGETSGRPVHRIHASPPALLGPDFLTTPPDHRSGESPGPGPGRPGETSGNSGVIYHQPVGEAVEGLVPVGGLGDLFPQPGFRQVAQQRRRGALEAEHAAVDGDQRGLLLVGQALVGTDGRLH